MKRFSKKILLVSFIIILHASNITSATYSNKTFLMPRPVGCNMAMEYTTWHNITRKTPNNQFGANFQVTGFYQESTNDTDIGKYFGVEKKNRFVIARTGEIKYDFIFHDNDAHSENTRATVKFEPDQTAYGVRFDYFQDLNFLLKGLYLKASTPLIRIENDIHMQISDATLLFENDALNQYFQGKKLIFAHHTNENLQAPLTHAKIDSKQDTSGFADVDLVLGHKIFDKKRYQIKLNLGLTIPTGNKVKGNYVFEPVRGNGRHWGFGGGIDAQIDVWQKKDWSLKLIHAYNYRYLFKDAQTRTLSLNKTSQHSQTNTNEINFSQYYLLGRLNAPANTELIPAANILTTALDITPGSQLEGILDFALTYKNFIFDIGYNLFFKQAESIKLKDNPFVDNQYGIIDVAFDVTDAADVTIGDFANQAALSTHDLDFDNSSTPAQFTHKIYGGLGYTLKKNDYSALLGIGASYEFATSNNELEVWALWAKIGFSF